MKHKITFFILLTALVASQFAMGQEVRQLKYKNGNVYTGTFDGRGRPSGYGTMRYANGDRYDGNWEKGRCQGEGVYNYAAGGRYEGNWEKGEIKGKGIFYYANGDVLSAEFTDGGTQTGVGKYTYAKGAVYEGELANGQPEGQGKMVWPNGATYTGQRQIRG